MSDSDAGKSDYGDDEKRPKSKATVVRSDDGTLYIIRQEILETCEVTEPEAIELCNKLLDSNPGVTGFQLGAGDAAKSIQFVGPFQQSDFDLQASGTTMCAGNMRWFDFTTVARNEAL